MQKKIGYLFGGFLVAVSIINFINIRVFFDINIWGLFLLGVAFIESVHFEIQGKVLQIITMLLTSSIMTLVNDPNSLVPVITLILAVLLSDRYFPNKKNLSKYYIMVPLMTSLFTGWNLASILNNLLLYIVLTAVLCIIQNDKV